MTSTSKATTTPAAAERPIDARPLSELRRSPTHPGEIFRHEFREPDGQVLISQAEAARRMRMTANRLNEFERGRRGVTAENAVLLAALTRTSPEFWMTLQARYDLWHAMKKMGKLPTIEPITAAVSSTE